TVLGTFALPLATTVALLALRLRFPIPAIAGAATLLFLFNEGNSMWGGNIPSTLAGEFAFSLGFALSVAFVGLLYRGVERQRGWRWLAALLALTGLCHPIAFLNATAAGLFFLLDRRHFARNLRFLLLTYGLAVLLMGFWLIPLVGKLPFATAINWKWHFSSWRELLPPILQPVAPLALLDLAWLAVRRRPEDRPLWYLAFAGLTSVVLFINATTLGLPEIRFAPFVQLVVLLLAVDALRRLLPLEPSRWPQDSPLRFAPHVGALAIALAMAAFAQSSSSKIPSWIRWNYTGLESKPSYPLLQDLMDQVRGSISDPRVAYENSPRHDRFGSMRIFEDMALLSGRATLEGVLLQTSINSPSIYFLQNQLSKQGTGVIPGYLYPAFHPERATPRLALYNAHDVIAVTPELRTAFEADPSWERVFARDDYAVFHLKDADPHYVRVPRYQPAVLDSADWKRDFHSWFASDDALEVPLLLASRMPPEERGRFPRAESPSAPPRVAIEAECEIEEHIDHLEIEFTTSCPGLPHWIAISYFPNWQVEGAQEVFLASPGFLLVVPEGPR
ncbi:MAG: 6-pyruvoyl-tetrahydropterin synthase-related protein, partial [Myxococcota bacterium]